MGCALRFLCARRTRLRLLWPAFLLVALLSPVAAQRNKPRTQPPADAAIAFEGRQGITVVNAAGLNAWVVFGKAGARRPNWSPDGQKLIFAYKPLNGRGTGLYLINLNGTGLCKLAPLANGSMSDVGSAWSPQAVGGQHWIVYTDSVPGNETARKILAVRASCSSPGTPLELGTANSAQNVSWSADAARLAVKVWNNSETPAGDTVLYDVVATGNGLQLTNPVRLSALVEAGAPDMSWAEWGRADDRLAFNIEDNIGVADLQSGTRTQITSSSDYYWEAFPSWSPRGDQIVVYTRTQAGEGYLERLDHIEVVGEGGYWIKSKLPPTVAMLSGLVVPRWRPCVPCE